MKKIVPLSCVFTMACAQIPFEIEVEFDGDTSMLPFNLDEHPNKFLPQKDSDSFGYVVYKSTNASPKIVRTAQEIIREGYDPQKKTIVMLHGYTSDNSFYTQFIRGGLLDDDAYNVIGVSWEDELSFPYVLARDNCLKYGKKVGSMLVELTRNTGQSMKKIHLVGHSLGAHGAGAAGRQVYEETMQKVGRISALDAASPLFTFYRESDAVTRSDALFVDAIHTNAGHLLPLPDRGVGVTEPFGHVDFYPSGGNQQPGCPEVGEYIVGITESFEAYRCNHNRAVEFFVESIRSGSFVAVRCKDYAAFTARNCPVGSSGRVAWSIMGFNTADSYRDCKMNFCSQPGRYFLDVNASPPYAKGWSILQEFEEANQDGKTEFDVPSEPKSLNISAEARLKYSLLELKLAKDEWDQYVQDGGEI